MAGHHATTRSSDFSSSTANKLGRNIVAYRVPGAARNELETSMSTPSFKASLARSGWCGALPREARHGSGTSGTLRSTGSLVSTELPSPGRLTRDPPDGARAGTPGRLSRDPPDGTRAGTPGRLSRDPPDGTHLARGDVASGVGSSALGVEQVCAAGSGQMLSAYQPASPESAPSAPSALPPAQASYTPVLPPRGSVPVAYTAAQSTVAPPSPPQSDLSTASSIAAKLRPKTRRSTTAAAPAPPPPEEPQPQPQPAADESGCGLTQASLKHLRRRCDALCEERTLHLAEIARLLALLKQQQQLGSAKAEGGREATLWQEVQEMRSLYEAECARTRDLQQKVEPLEEAVADSETEVARLRQLLEEEQRAGKVARQEEALKIAVACEDAAQAAEKAAKQNNSGVAEKLAELEDALDKLRREKRELKEERNDLSRSRDEWKRKAQVAKEEAEKLADMKAAHKKQVDEQVRQRVQEMRTALVAELIQSKLELHIVLPQVVLSYNDAPPLVVSLARGLSQDFLRSFLDTQLFPNFTPLWICLDKVDKAPDGTNEKAYSDKISNLLTNAVKDFIHRSSNEDDFLGSVCVPGLLSWQET